MSAELSAELSTEADALPGLGAAGQALLSALVGQMALQQLNAMTL